MTWRQLAALAVVVPLFLYFIVRFVTWAASVL